MSSVSEFESVSEHIINCDSLTCLKRRETTNVFMGVMKLMF